MNELNDSPEGDTVVVDLGLKNAAFQSPNVYHEYQFVTPT